MNEIQTSQFIASVQNHYATMIAGLTTEIAGKDVTLNAQADEILRLTADNENLKKVIDSYATQEKINNGDSFSQIGREEAPASPPRATHQARRKE